MPGHCDAPTAHLFHGLCYGPFREGQSPETGTFPTEAQVRQDLDLIKTLTGVIRTYGVDHILSRIPEFCHDSGLGCYPGAWVDNTPADQSQVDALKVIGLQERPTTRGLVVGNEFLHRHNSTAARDRLIAWMQEVRNSTGMPVGAAEQWHVWDQHPGLGAEADFLFVHVHPYHENQAVENATAFVRGRYQHVRSLFPDKPVIIAETGWPSAGSTKGAAVPSLAGHLRFLREFRAMAHVEGIEHLVFAAADEPWKAAFAESEAHWGLLDKDRHDKGGVADLLRSHAQVRLMPGALKVRVFEGYPYQIRHGTDLVSWPESLGSLTGTGMEQNIPLSHLKPRGFYRAELTVP